MADIYIRGLDDEIKARLTRQAKESRVSLNRYICSVLADYALHPELSTTEERYQALAENMTTLYKDLLERTDDILIENMNVLDKVVTLLVDNININQT